MITKETLCVYSSPTTSIMNMSGNETPQVSKVPYYTSKEPCYISKKSSYLFSDTLHLYVFVCVHVHTYCIFQAGAVDVLPLHEVHF